MAIRETFMIASFWNRQTKSVRARVPFVKLLQTTGSLVKARMVVYGFLNSSRRAEVPVT